MDGRVTNNSTVTNNPPSVASGPDGTVGTAFSYVFPANTFSDADTSDTLTYTATKAAGTDLPLWLAFAASTRTFSGTPTDAGMVALKVTASDGNGGSVSDEFDIVVAAAGNNAPTVANTIPDQTATVGTAFSYVFPANTFSDADTSDTLTYTATKAAGTDLPLWLAFAASTRTFSGTPTDAGMVALKVTASDGNGGSVSDEFDIVVAAAGNNAPTVANTIPDQTATVGTAFSYVFPANTFSDADTSDTLTYTATKAAGTDLPLWLAFAASTRTFSGTPTDAGMVALKVTASDGNGGSVSDEFDIVVAAAGNNAPTVANTIPDQTATVGDGVQLCVSGEHVQRRGHQRHPDLHGDESRRHGSAPVAGLRRQHPHLLGHANGRGDGVGEGDRQRRQRRVGQRYLRYHGERRRRHHPAHADQRHGLGR